MVQSSGSELYQQNKGFTNLPFEIRAEVGEWLDETGQPVSAMNLSLVEKAMRDCMKNQSYRTVVWVHKGKNKPMKWWYPVGSAELQAIRHLVQIVKPTFSNQHLEHRLQGKIWQVIPQIKSVATWDRYDANTGKWGKAHNAILYIYIRHSPSDFLRTARSLFYIPSDGTKRNGLKGMALKVIVNGRETREEELEEARRFYPEQAYGLRDVTLYQTEGQHSPPASLIAQFGGALSFEQWETTLVLCNLFKWGENNEVKCLIADIAAINPRSFHTNLKIRIPCGDEMPIPGYVRSLVVALGKKWITAIELCPRKSFCSLSLEIYDSASNTVIVKLSPKMAPRTANIVVRCSEGLRQPQRPA